MGAQSSCLKTMLQTPVGSLSCDACGTSCMKDAEQEPPQESPQSTPKEIAQRAIADHNLQVISRLVESESDQVQNNFATIVRELLAAGIDPSSITVESKILTPQPGLRRMTTSIVHGDTNSENLPLWNPLPPTLHQVEEAQESDKDDPPPLNPPTLERQTGIYIQVPKP